MKTPTARQLPSGSWFVRVKVNGVEHSITRPTKKEAEREALALKSGAKKAAPQGECTLSEAIDRYIEARKRKSPETIRGYRKIQRNRFQDAMTWNIYRTPQEKWQKLVNAEADLVSPKYLKNAWFFVSAVITEATGQRVHVTLPTVAEKDLNFLTSDEVPLFMKAIEGDSCELQMLLALNSLRKSEILDITWDDIDLKNNLIHVRGAAVFDEKNQLVHKQTNKNETSTRTIPILIPRITVLAAAADKSTPYVHQGDPNKIYRHTVAACKRAGVTVCSLHDLRRTFASICYHLKISELSCQRLGGWKDYMTLRKVYIKLSQRDHNAEIQRIQQFYSNAPDVKV